MDLPSLLCVHCSQYLQVSIKKINMIFSFIITLTEKVKSRFWNRKGGQWKEVYLCMIKMPYIPLWQNLFGIWGMWWYLWVFESERGGCGPPRGVAWRHCARRWPRLRVTHFYRCDITSKCQQQSPTALWHIVYWLTLTYALETLLRRWLWPKN